MTLRSVSRAGRPVLLGELSWVEVVELTVDTELVILPVGAVEQHGPHLPLLVDAITVEALACEASTRAGAAVAPTVAYSSSQGHSQLFPGTLALSPETAQATLEELGAWLANAGFKKLLLLNGHLGNTGVVWNAVDNLIATLGSAVSVAGRSWWDLTPELWQMVTKDAPTAPGEFHANWTETSLMLFLRPDLVRMDRAVDQDEVAWAFDYDMSRKSRSGAIGRQITQSTAADGERIFAVAAEALAETIERMSKEQPPSAPPDDVGDVGRWRTHVARELRGAESGRAAAQATDVPTSRYALLPGDPGRVERLLRQLDDTAVIAEEPPFVMGTGTLDGTPVIVAATGMGGPSVAHMVQRLADRGIDTFIRVGGAGPVIDQVRPNEIVVASAAVRHEGTSSALIADSWPAIASPSVVQALLAAAANNGVTVRCGVVHTKDSFFGEVDPASSPVEAQLRASWRTWQRLGVLASEMEASVLFALAIARGWRAGAIVKINDIEGQDGSAWTDDEDLCALAVAGLARLIHNDR